MDSEKWVAYIMIPLQGVSAEQMALGQGYATVARATSPDAAGAVIAALCKAPDPTNSHIRIELRREL